MASATIPWLAMVDKCRVHPLRVSYIPFFLPQETLAIRTCAALGTIASKTAECLVACGRDSVLVKALLEALEGSRCVAAPVAYRCVSLEHFFPRLLLAETEPAMSCALVSHLTSGSQSLGNKCYYRFVVT